MKATSNVVSFLALTSVPKKSIPSAVVIHYCAWYTFFWNRRYQIFGRQDRHSGGNITDATPLLPPRSILKNSGKTLALAVLPALALKVHHFKGGRRVDTPKMKFLYEIRKTKKRVRGSKIATFGTTSIVDDP